MIKTTVLLSIDPSIVIRHRTLATFFRMSTCRSTATIIFNRQPNQSLMFCSQRTDNRFYDFSLKLIIAISGRVRSVVQPGETACK